MILVCRFITMLIVFLTAAIGSVAMLVLTIVASIKGWGSFKEQPELVEYNYEREV